MVKKIDETSGFAARRELIDEYGWRDWGELSGITRPSPNHS